MQSALRTATVRRPGFDTGNQPDTSAGRRRCIGQLAGPAQCSEEYEVNQRDDPRATDCRRVTGRATALPTLWSTASAPVSRMPLRSEVRAAPGLETLEELVTATGIGSGIGDPGR